MYIYSLLLVVAAVVSQHIDDYARNCIKNMTDPFVFDYNMRLCLRWNLKETSFMQAMGICEDYGGRLAVFDTRLKIAFLQLRLAHNTDEEFFGMYRGNTWVGMDNRTGNFRWFNGRPIDMEFASTDFKQTLKTGKPPLYDCVYFSRKDYLLRNGLCTSHFKYVCEKPL